MQRYATTWSGDIDPKWEEMEKQIRAMLVSGLSGFPYFNHDAGGFFAGVNDDIYRQWSLAFGSFTPIWRPHGLGESRWPLDRTALCQKDALVYSQLRYTLMPYLYSYAYLAYATGLPIARAMFLEYPDLSAAWDSDQQYLWGDHMLIAPVCSNMDKDIKVWLPPDTKWYEYWNDKLHTGGSTITHHAPKGILPIFVRAGAVIPSAPYAHSTFFIAKDTLVIDLYTGGDGTFNLHEDDGVTEKYKDGEFRTTKINFNNNNFNLVIGKSKGTYDGAPGKKAYKIKYHGLTSEVSLYCNSVKPLEKYKSISALTQAKQGQYWDNEKKILTVFTEPFSVDSQVIISKVPVSAIQIQTRRSPPAIRFPRQGVSVLYIDGLEKNENAILQITTLQGTMLLTSTLKDKRTFTVPFSLATGIYLARLVTSDADVSQRFIVAGVR